MSQSPVRWLAGLAGWAYALLVVAAVAVVVVVGALANPGHEVGPIQPARPPVGHGPLPATSPP
ncbi:MAG TPA: hypothetical protein VGM93_09890 [Acidimicrobiales bacterium]